ncbi:hypothetical protein LCGC14_2088810 [marine sediment metagenome]|uniref:Uncharacterized protein n=1 Tax=marine sediment metagenome TaxID=412755 RepID=A0A0F9F0R1_9ZZZZ
MPIHVICRTNLDAFARETWPKEMACRPVVGDMVESAAGKVLRVIGITHSYGEVMGSVGHMVTRPLLKVELNQRLYRP